MFLLFDFDGTLVDSFDCVVEKAMQLADEFSLRRLESHEIEDLRHLSSKEVIKFLEVPFYKIPKLLYKMRQHLHDEIKNLSPFPDIYQVVEQLYHAESNLGILTSNSVENVTLWLELHQMRQFFKFIHTEPKYFTKKYLLKKTIQSYKINQSEAYYIGDETRDIDAAKKNNIHSVAVTWGYNSERALQKYAPSFIAKKPRDLLTICGIKSDQ